VHEIAVGLVGLSTMLGELVASLLAEDPGLRIVPAERADVVVSGPGADPRALLDRSGPRAVVVLRDDGRTAELVELVVHRRDLGEATSRGLVEAVRAAAGTGGA
jgi:hypothetical protein